MDSGEVRKQDPDDKSIDSSFVLISMLDEPLKHVALLKSSNPDYKKHRLEVRVPVCPSSHPHAPSAVSIVPR